MGYKVSSIQSLSDLSPGTHVRVVRGQMVGFSGGLYDHHMLVTAVLSATLIKVIHYTTGSEFTDRSASSSASPAWFGGDRDQPLGVIAEEDIAIKPKELELLEYEDGITKFTPEQAIARARGRLHEKDYSLFSNNCECLVNWALRGEAVSYQVVDGVLASAQGVFAGVKEGYSKDPTWSGALTGGLMGALTAFQEHREKRSEKRD